MRSKGSAEQLEARRRLAVQRVADGWTRKAVAAHRAGGDAALAAKPHPGRQPFLTPDQQARVLGWLAEKPTAHGFRTDLWTARRVAELIRQRFGVAYHPDYVRAWLTERGYT